MKNYADTVLKNGQVYTADKKNTIHQAIAIKNGSIIAIGSDDEIKPYITTETEVIDLQGKTAMPGIIDSHMHPMWGAKQLCSESLDYKSLDVVSTLKVLQADLDKESAYETTDPDKWLIIRAWLCIGGSTMNKNDLDKLKTKRPVMLFSNDCHYLALNTKGLEILGIKNKAPLPDDGVIVLDRHSKPIGLIEDGTAMNYFDQITALGVKEGIQVFLVAQKQLNRQGVTTIMDARALDEEFKVFRAMQEQNKLSLRILGAVEIKPHDLKTPETLADTIKKIKTFKNSYATENWQAHLPAISIHQAKFFIDGMIPSKTAYMLEPYLENQGTKEHPKFVKTDDCGKPFFTAKQLDYVLTECALNDIDPHMHTIADGAIEICLNAIEKMRKNIGDKDIRPALAHNDVTAPHQYKRFHDLKVTANLSFQWAGYTDKIINLHQDLIGEEQIKNKFETHGKFFDASVNVAYNSDWPIDPLNEWGNLQVGLTRRIDSDHPRLNSDRDLTPIEVLRAVTINAAYALKKDDVIGSLEEGKFADIIILKQDPFTIDKTLFSTIKVLRTIIGGKTVYQA